MFTIILLIYFSILVAIFLSTVILLVFGKNWGDLPHAYVKLLNKIQERYSPVLCVEPSCGKRLRIIQKRHAGRFLDRIQAAYKAHCFKRGIIEPNEEFLFDECDYMQIFDLQTDIIQAGIESVVQDDLSFTCDGSPVSHWNALTLPYCPSCNTTTWKNILLYVIFSIGCLIRFFIIFPVRLSFMFMAALWITGCSIVLSIFSCTQKQRLYMCASFSRLFCCSIGLVAKYEGGRKNRPRSPGIAVANHMSANDVQVIAADIQYNDPYHDFPIGFSITGQRHTGFIGWAERMGGKITNALWFERSDEGQRRDFRNKVLNIARDVRNDPILMFPEGYCTNNTTVYQFRRAVFADGIDIYPIAMKQDPRLGDAFWLEDNYVAHLIRLMSSWATVYTVKYLPKMRKKYGESAEEFAKRVQTAIAESLDIDTVLFDGRLLKSEDARQRMKASNQAQIGSMIKILCAFRNKARVYSISYKY